MQETDRTLLEREIDDLLQRLNTLSRSGRGRRWLAYGLKIVAGGSGLVIAIDVVGAANKWLGAAILVAVFVDAVFANYERLIGEVRASHAAKITRTRIMAEHNRNLAPLVAQMRNSSPDIVAGDEASAAKDRLELSTHEKLLAAVAEIEEALAALDLSALKSLSLEAERTGAAKS